MCLNAAKRRKNVRFAILLVKCEGELNMKKIPTVIIFIVFAHKISSDYRETWCVLSLNAEKKFFHHQIKT
jgi:hypothetical protein